MRVTFWGAVFCNKTDRQTDTKSDWRGGLKLSMREHTYNPSTQEDEAGRQRPSLDHIARLCKRRRKKETRRFVRIKVSQLGIQLAITDSKHLN